MFSAFISLIASMKPIALLFIAIRLALGGMMLYGGYQKFAKPIPAPTQFLTEVQEKGADHFTSKPEILKIKNYIFGMKQTNYLWQLLGICELVFGLMLISQFLAFAGAVMLMPITLNIFLFHAFLEPHEVGELVEVTLLLIANILLIAKEFPRWKSLVWIPPFAAPAA